MRTALAAAVLAVASLMAAAASAQQQPGTLFGPNSRQSTLPDNGVNRQLPDTADRMNGRLPERQIPQLQNRDEIASAPPALQERFSDYCRSRGGCPGGYVQNQADFALYEQQQQQKARDDMTRNLQRGAQPTR